MSWELEASAPFFSLPPAGASSPCLKSFGKFMPPLCLVYCKVATQPGSPGRKIICSPVSRGLLESIVASFPKKTELLGGGAKDGFLLLALLLHTVSILFSLCLPLLLSSHSRLSSSLHSPPPLYLFLAELSLFLGGSLCFLVFSTICHSYRWEK